MLHPDDPRHPSYDHTTPRTTTVPLPSDKNGGSSSHSATEPLNPDPNPGGGGNP
jgi:hypothetical protein